MTEEFDSEPQEEVKQVLPWITGLEAFTRYGKNIPALRLLVKEKKVRVKKINGKDLYSTDDLDSLVDEEENPAVNMGDLLRAARDLLLQGQRHHETMYEKYMASFEKITKGLADQIDKQNEHILNLEKQAMEMREATDKVFNLEHTRKMDELKEERKRQMQAKAIDMIQKMLGPWVMQKLGAMGMSENTKTPEGTPSEASVNDPRLAQLGQAVVGMVVSMTDEKFESLKSLIGEEEYMVLAAIREGMKS